MRIRCRQSNFRILTISKSQIFRTAYEIIVLIQNCEHGFVLTGRINTFCDIYIFNEPLNCTSISPIFTVERIEIFLERT